MYVLVFSTAIIKVEKQQGINSGKNPNGKALIRAWRGEHDSQESDQQAVTRGENYINICKH